MWLACLRASTLKGWAEPLLCGHSQEAKRHVESEAAHLRAQLTAASHVLADSAGEIKELKVCSQSAVGCACLVAYEAADPYARLEQGELMFMQGCLCDANAEVARLRGRLDAAETQVQSVQSAATARTNEVRGAQQASLLSAADDSPHSAAGGDRFSSHCGAGVLARGSGRPSSRFARCPDRWRRP